MNDYGRSIIRTFVPLIVGAIAGWFATQNVNVDSATIFPLVETIVAAGYYAAARALEHRWPELGWLLGSPGAPSYANRSSIPPVETAENPVAQDESLPVEAISATFPEPVGDPVEPAVD